MKGDGVLEQVLENWETAPVDARTKATLGFLHKLTRKANEVTSQDVDAVRAAGVSDTALLDAVYVATIFSYANRFSHALDFEVPAKDELPNIAKALLKFGYSV